MPAKNVDRSQEHMGEGIDQPIVIEKQKRNSDRWIQRINTASL